MLQRRIFLTSSACALAQAVAMTPTAAKPVNFNIEVAQYPGFDYGMPVAIAQRLGYMQREGIVLGDITGSNGGGTSIRNISQGGLSLGLVATSAAIKAIVAGEDLKIIAGGVQTPGTCCWVVKKNSPIKSIHDFVGKRVGYTQPSSSSQAMITLCLQGAGIDPATVQLIAAGGVGDNLVLLDGGGLDVAFTVDPTLSQHENELRLIFYVREYLPHYMQTVWVATPQVLRDQKDLIAGFLRACAQAVDYIVEHPLQSAHIYAQLGGAEERYLALGLAHERPTEYFGKGELNIEGVKLAIDSMRLGKLIGPEKIDLARICDQSALPPSQRVGLRPI
jgi:NitT/TauT family transport system substrate-binding protein